MSCYFRHLKDVMGDIGIEVTSGNKKEIDRAIHAYAGIEYKNCSAAWKEIKEMIRSDDKRRKKFIAAIKKELKGL